MYFSKPGIPDIETKFIFRLSLSVYLVRNEQLYPYLSGFACSETKPNSSWEPLAVCVVVSARTTNSKAPSPCDDGIDALLDSTPSRSGP